MSAFSHRVGNAVELRITVGQNNMLFSVNNAFEPNPDLGTKFVLNQHVKGKSNIIMYN